MKYFLVLAAHAMLLGCAVHDRATGDKPVSESTETIPKENESQPPGEQEKEIRFSSRSEADNFLDLKAISDTCKTHECIFSDLEPNLISKDAGIYQPKPMLLEKLSTGIQALPRPKAVNVTSTRATADLGGSILYGAEDRISELGLDEKCGDSWKLSKGNELDTAAALKNSIEDGGESVNDSRIDMVVVIENLQLTGRETAGIFLKDSEVVASYREAELLGFATTTYTDYDSMAGIFTLPPDALAESSPAAKMWRALRDLFSSAAAFAALTNHPAGYPLPQTGYGGDPDAFMPNDPICNNPNPTTKKCEPKTADWWCRIGGSQPACENPMAWRNVPFCETVTLSPISAYYPKIRSKRIAAGSGSVQCNAMLPGIAQSLKLGDEWRTTSPNVQWFVRDAAWPGCGGYNCPDKVARASANDAVAANVEPVDNYCIDRWAGLDYNTYLATLQADCQNTDIYRNAVALKAKNDTDQAFASSCKADSACNSAVSAIPLIRSAFPIEDLRTKIEAEELALQNAKTSATSYLIKNSYFTRTSRQSLVDLVGKITGGLDKAEALRKAVSLNADWNEGANLVHSRGTTVGFTAYAESKATASEYERLIARISELTKPQAKKVSCSYAATGRFRQYNSSKLLDLRISSVTLEPKTSNTKLLQDLRQ